jgi:hypothetical protein
VEKETLNSKMEINILVISKTTNFKVKEFINKMEMFMKELFSTVNIMGKARWYIIVETIMKVILNSEKSMDKDFIHGQMEITMMEIGLTIALKARVLL